MIKKIFKYGCGCLIVLSLISAFLIVIVQSCSDSSESGRNTSAEKGTPFPTDANVRWERRTAEVANAKEYLRDYCMKNGLREGFDTKKQIFCRITTWEFDLIGSPADRNFRIRHANQIRRAALEALLHNLYCFSQSLDDRITDSTDGKISSATELRLKNSVFCGKQTAISQRRNNSIAEDFSETLSLSYMDRKLIEYKCDADGERFTMAPVSPTVRGSLSETDRYSMLEPFLRLLISEGLPVISEYSAYSWDEKQKRGQVALLLVYNCKDGKR